MPDLQRHTAFLRQELGLGADAIQGLLKVHPCVLLAGPRQPFQALCALMELDAALVTVRKVSTWGFQGYFSTADQPHAQLHASR